MTAPSNPANYKNLLRQAFVEVKQVRARVEELERAQREAIAIIGIGCRFPGGDSPEGFWELLRTGGDAIREVPKDRWDVDAFYDPDPDAPGKMSTRWGGFLTGVDLFDAGFFGISPREAERMDPQQRLFLAVAWEALESAGQAIDRLAGSSTGVFVGVCNSDYTWLEAVNPGGLGMYSGTGNSFSVVAGRLSYLLDLRGPSVAVDTACSSSLVAVHMACQNLRNKECNLAIAGGVSLTLLPHATILSSKMRLLAPDGRCKTFDSRADGIVPGEGCGVVVLKRLPDALAGGDPILAIIRGSAVNQDGRSAGLAAPNVLSQRAVIRQALDNAGVEPSRLSFIEAHGTGTSLGDPIEMEALTEVIGPPRFEGQSCAIGSVKTNIGHTGAAAGIAGLIKVALALQHGAIPPHLHFRELNPNISLKGTPFFIPTRVQPWPQGAAPRCAGVSSFGWAGTNIHMVLEEAPPVSQPPQENQRPGRSFVLPLSARSPEALQSVAESYRMWLSGAGAALPLEDICYTASVRRTHHPYRLAAAGASCAELIERLEAFQQAEAVKGKSVSMSPDQRPGLVFVFAGQGSQWRGMGRELFGAEPVFQARIEACDELVRRFAGWSLLEQFTAEESRSRLEDTEIAQPMLLALQLALADLWRSWGIAPGSVVGHSLGEIAAAHVAGVLSLEDAVRISVLRGRLMQRVKGRGGMAAVEAAAAAVEDRLSGRADALSIAAFNSPASTVLSGETALLDALVLELEQQGMSCRRLPGEYAFHSPQMAELQQELVRALRGLKPQPAQVPLISTVTGRPAEGREWDAEYWGRNLREPVRFASAVVELLQLGPQVFLEISPHPTLGRPIAQCAREAGEPAAILSSLRRKHSDRDVLMDSLGSLYRLGHDIEWRRLYHDGGRCVSLPAYPWQLERFWLDAAQIKNNALLRPVSSGRSESPAHPQLGRRLKSAVDAAKHFWEMDLDVHLYPNLNDHRVHGVTVFPGAAYVQLVLAAAEEALGPGPHILEEVAFIKALTLAEEGGQTVQLVISADRPEAAVFQFFSRSTEAGKLQAPWDLHATGAIRSGSTECEVAAPEHASPAEIQARCRETVSGAEHYRAMHAVGFEYGPSFQSVKEIWRRDAEAIALLRTESPETMADFTSIHAGLLDSCFQVVASAMPKDDASLTGHIFMLAGVRRFRFLRRPAPGAKLWCHALLHQAGTGGDAYEGDVFLLDEAGAVVLEASGLRARQFDANLRGKKRDDINDWLYRIQWQPADLKQGQDPVSLPADAPAPWLVFTDSGGVGDGLIALLEAAGQTCVAVSPAERNACIAQGRYQVNPARAEGFQYLLTEAFDDRRLSCRGVVHLWSLDAPPPDRISLESLDGAERLGCGSVLHLTQALVHAGWRDAPRLWLVTRGAQPLGQEDSSLSIAQSPLWGLSRVIAIEQPQLRCTSIDLGPVSTAEMQSQALLRELYSNDAESQVAWRAGARYAARLMRSSAAQAPAESRDVAAEKTVSANGGVPYRLEVTTPGILENLKLKETPRPEPGPGQVAVKVEAAGLNFSDVMKALGIYPGLPDASVPLGIECSGTVVAVGEGVEDLRAGDDVIAVAPNAIGSFVSTSALFAVRKPAALGFEEAATIPVAFLTAYYALHHLGRLSAGERVLIHSAAGGVGLAAVQLAQRAGAEVFATAGTPEKQEFLRSLGIAHVMDSRSLGFAEEVSAITNGAGVDVVLNSLAGEAIARSLSVLAPYGRFLELGKRDIYQNAQMGLSPFQRSLTYSAIDLERMFVERPALCRSLLREVTQCFEDGTLRPLRHRVFPISDAAGAFRYMAQGKHIGKIVISTQCPAVSIVPASPSPGASPEAPPATSAHSTYLVTGGLGGLGLTVARWLAGQGARHLVLLGRSSPSVAARAAVAELEQAGVQVRVVQADVAREQEVARVLEEVEEAMPPLRGVVHAAGIIDDGLLPQLTLERFAAVMAPKVKGAWNLHTHTLNCELDFFVLFSSASAVLGSPGQGNYAAANAFLDALAHYRRSQGRPALSVAWGPWGEVGLAARSETRRRLALRGVTTIAPEQGVEALGRLLRQALVQAAVMPLDLRQWYRFYPAAAELPFFAGLAQELDASGRSQRRDSAIRKALLAMEAGSQRRSLLESHLQEQVGLVLGLPPSRIDARTPLDSLGLDSLTALELGNRLEASLGVTLSPTLVWNYPTIGALAPYLAGKMDISISPAEQAAPDLHDETAMRAAVSSDVARLSEDEAEAMLLQELSRMDELQARSVTAREDNDE